MASGLLHVCDTKQSPAEWLLQQVGTPVHCHREKQQGFTSLHSAISHCVGDLLDGSTERRLTLAEVEPSNGFGGWLTDVGRHFRLIVLHAMPEVTTFWEDAPSGLLRVCDTKQSPADWLLLRVETPVRCHRENLQGSTSLHFVGSHNGNGFRECASSRRSECWVTRTF